MSSSAIKGSSVYNTTLVEYATGSSGYIKCCGRCGWIVAVKHVLFVHAQHEYTLHSGAPLPTVSYADIQVIIQHNRLTVRQFHMNRESSNLSNNRIGELPGLRAVQLYVY